MRKTLAMTVVALSVLGATAMSAAAEDTVKIGYIDPLSGGGASIGEGGLKTFQYLADELNAKGGILGHKVEIVPLDNKVNPQESLVQAQKAIDAGIHYITQGNGSSVAAALEDFVTKNNYAQSRQGSAVLQLRRRRSEPDQREVQLLALPLGCRLGHQDGSADQLHEGRSVDQEGLPDQPGLFVRPVGARRRAQDARRPSGPTSRSSATNCIRC